jgi:hypothetical protein
VKKGLKGNKIGFLQKQITNYFNQTALILQALTQSRNFLMLWICYFGNGDPEKRMLWIGFHLNGAQNVMGHGSHDQASHLQACRTPITVWNASTDP